MGEVLKSFAWVVGAVTVSLFLQSLSSSEETLANQESGDSYVAVSTRANDSTYDGMDGANFTSTAPDAAIEATYP